MKKLLSIVLTLLMLLEINVTTSAKAILIPKLQMVTQPVKEYKEGDRISFVVQSPNYTGKVEYRVILYNGTTKKTYELWSTPKTGYYYKGWQPTGNYKFPISWTVKDMDKGAYSMTVLVRKVGSKAPYDSYVKTNSFFVVDTTANEESTTETKTDQNPSTSNGTSTGNSTPSDGIIKDPNDPIHISIVDVDVDKDTAPEVSTVFGGKGVMTNIPYDVFNHSEKGEEEQIKYMYRFGVSEPDKHDENLTYKYYAGSIHVKGTDKQRKVFKDISYINTTTVATGELLDINDNKVMVTNRVIRGYGGGYDYEIMRKVGKVDVKYKYFAVCNKNLYADGSYKVYIYADIFEDVIYPDKTTETYEKIIDGTLYFDFNGNIMKDIINGVPMNYIKSDYYIGSHHDATVLSEQIIFNNADYTSSLFYGDYIANELHGEYNNGYFVYDGIVFCIK